MRKTARRAHTATSKEPGPTASRPNTNPNDRPTPRTPSTTESELRNGPMWQEFEADVFEGSVAYPATEHLRSDYRGATRNNRRHISPP
jgi:hypothetical protein